MVKLGEFCGFSVILKCQLPDGDLETLVSIKSDEDLANLIEEYDRASSRDSTRHQIKIRAILLPRMSLKKISPPMSTSHSVEDFASLKSPLPAVKSVPNFFVSRGTSPPSVRFSGNRQRGSGRVSYYYPCHVQENSNRIHHHHHHHHHRHEVPRSYYWQ